MSPQCVKHSKLGACQAKVVRADVCEFSLKNPFGLACGWLPIAREAFGTGTTFVVDIVL